MNKYQYTVQGVDYEVEIMEVEGNIAKVNVNGIPFEVEMKRPINPITAAQRPKSATPVVTPAPAAAPASAPQRQTQPKAAVGAGKKITAPLPGTITDVKVKVGDTVKNGDTVLVLEAMKMQNNIEAECDGTITSVVVSKGDTVMEGDALVTIG